MKKNFTLIFAFFLTVDLFASEIDEITIISSRDTSMIILEKKLMNKKSKNANFGGDQFLICDKFGSMFFIAFDLFDELEKVNVSKSEQIISAEIELYADQINGEKPHGISIRRVLLPWNEGKQISTIAQKRDLTYSSCLYKSLLWNKPAASAMLKGIDGDRLGDYNGSHDVAHRIDAKTIVNQPKKWFAWKGELITDAVRFWIENPDFNYGYVFQISDRKGKIKFASKENKNLELRPRIKIRFQKEIK